MENCCKGKLIIIGGAEDKEGEKEILKYVAEESLKNNGELTIATIATEYPSSAWDKYKKVFSGLGIKKMNVLDVSERKDSFNPVSIETIKKSSVIFFTGGDQLRITSLVGGTPIFQELRNVFMNGCILVGTSAGASVMSSTMIVKGDDEESPRKCTLKMAPGFGFIKNVIIDQHFAQRGRIGRLLAGIAQNPEMLGVGIDEDTAIVVENNVIRVIGNGAVYFLDGEQITFSNVSEKHQDEILSMYNVKMHVLTNGNLFHLQKRTPFEEENTKNENNK
ncbi:cyanophycinase [Clostridium paridis]|uniref:Cyanophycinase n=1 Tax=Clostridium paridis TaxID=2803863 RepID=A0A937FIF4_9CLOT|nr:cyanophycinase [Clostridium paridis]MBL4932703.1 cyanophycinase [Clostridium paridis]